MGNNRFVEQKQPTGSNKFNLLNPIYGDTLRVVPPGTRVERVKECPWLCVLWEPLTSKVPGPHLAKPYCCYARTVVFYVRGYILRQFYRIYKIGEKWAKQSPGCNYEEWAQMEHVFTHNDLISFENDTFAIGGGTVIYYQKTWYMLYLGRKQKTNNLT